MHELLARAQRRLEIVERRVQEICYQGSKRSFETFSKTTSGRSEWLCDAAIKLAVLESVLGSVFTSKHTTKIVIPGIGHSTLAQMLIGKKYDVTVCDLDEEQVSDSNRKLKIEYFDLLKDDVPDRLVDAFDCVVDSSVTDVFMQLESAAAPNTRVASQVYDKLCSMLRPQGVIVTFSMNNQAWEGIVSPHVSFRQHMVIRPRLQLTTKSGRQTTKRGEDVLVLVASSRPLELKPVNIVEKATDDWTDALPEVWESQRP